MPILIRKVWQASGIVLLLSTGFLFASVWSYTPDDPTWNHYISRPDVVIHNLGGALGASLADWGLQLLGSTIFLLLGSMLLSAWSLIRARLLPVVYMAGGGLVLVLATSATLYVLYHHDPFFGGTVFAGGLSGKWAVDILGQYLTLPHIGGYVALTGATLLIFSLGLYYRHTLGRALPARATVPEPRVADLTDLQPVPAMQGPGARRWWQRAQRTAPSVMGTPAVGDATAPLPASEGSGVHAAPGSLHTHTALSEPVTAPQPEAPTLTIPVPVALREVADQTPAVPPPSPAPAAPAERTDYITPVPASVPPVTRL